RTPPHAGRRHRAARTPRRAAARRATRTARARPGARTRYRRGRSDRPRDPSALRPRRARGERARHPPRRGACGGGAAGASRARCAAGGVHVLLIALVAAIAFSPAAPAKNKGCTPAQTRALIVRFVNAFNRGDAPTLNRVWDSKDWF